MALELGIDEAGRGPVIGPMVIAGTIIRKEDEKMLKAIGVKDSKLLAEKKREELFSKIRDIAVAYEILVVPAKEIDECIKSAEINLNWLEAIKAAEIISRLSEKHKLERAVIDCPSNNKEAYRRYLQDRLLSGKKPKLIVEHKADLNYISVSAASILAKVTREKEIKKLKKAYGDFGSGYPSDPKTRKFLEENIELPIYRRSWESWKKAFSKKSQKSLDLF